MNILKQVLRFCQKRNKKKGFRIYDIENIVAKTTIQPINTPEFVEGYKFAVQGGESC